MLSCKKGRPDRNLRDLRADEDEQTGGSGPVSYTHLDVYKRQGYKVIAEGAETEKEVKLLEKWGVDMIQGYYFSRPLCEEKLLEKIS